MSLRTGLFFLKSSVVRIIIGFLPKPFTTITTDHCRGFRVNALYDTHIQSARLFNSDFRGTSDILSVPAKYPGLLQGRLIKNLAKG